MRPFSWAGQSSPVQRGMTSPSLRSTWAPHWGQRSGTGLSTSRPVRRSGRKRTT